VLIKEADSYLEASRSDQVSDTGATTSPLSPTYQASSAQTSGLKGYPREQERNKPITTSYQKNATLQLPAQSPSIKSPLPQQLKPLQTGTEESQPKTFFERCVNLEFLSKSESKDFSDFIYSLKDQYNTARYIRQSKSHPVEASKAMRLKRDFKSTFILAELKTIILDLDETLLHTEDFKAGNSYDYVFDLESAQNQYKKEVLSVSLENWRILQTLPQRVPRKDVQEVRAADLHRCQTRLRRCHY
jgi:hypothetical protein